MMHDIQWPSTGITTSGDGTMLAFPDGDIAAGLEKRFRERVDVLLFGDTHEELICYYAEGSCS